MTKRSGIIFILIGVVLILSALLLFGYNMHEDKAAGDASSEMLEDVKAEIIEAIKTPAESTDDVAETDTSDTTAADTEPLIPEMPVKNVNGYDFIGYVTVPSADIELPVLNDWDYDRLDIAPCRHSGSTVTDDLVIAGHNFTSHFARLEQVKVGDIVTFTNMLGDVITYKVAKTDIHDGGDVEGVLESGYALALYTCTYEGTTRIVVFCERV